MISKKMAILPIALIVSFSSIYPMAWHQQPDSVLANNLNADGISDLEMKMAYNAADDEVKGIVEHLKDPKYYDDSSFRSALFYGEPGTGKTTTAWAISKYANWDCQFRRPTDYQKGNRGDAAQNFRLDMEKIVAGGAPTLLVIDEANGMWENTESKNHDTAETAKEMWQWMGKINGKNKVFIILIANRIHQMTPQFKNRLIDHMHEFIMPISVDDKYKTFNTMFSLTSMTLPDVSVAEVKKVIGNNAKWTARDYKGFIFKIKSYMKHTLKVAPTGVVAATTIAEVAKARAVREKKIQYYDKELSDTDRQDLYQVQNMWTNILIQRLQKYSILGRTPGITQNTGNFIMDKVTTDNQRRVAQELIDVSELQRPYLFNELA